MIQHIFSARKTRKQVVLTNACEGLIPKSGISTAFFPDFGSTNLAHETRKHNCMHASKSRIYTKVIWECGNTEAHRKRENLAPTMKIEVESNVWIQICIVVAQFLDACQLLICTPNYLFEISIYRASVTFPDCVRRYVRNLAHV